MADNFNILDIASGGAFESALLQVEDQKPSGTNGGSSVDATDNIRTLNTVITNEISGASLSSNQIILPAGNYFIEAQAPAYKANEHMIKLWNDTDSSYILYGTSMSAKETGRVYSVSNLTGRFTLSATKNLEIHHLIETGLASIGLGIDSGSAHVVDHETYTVIKIWKV